MDKQEEFKRRILATFRIEAQENIDAMSSFLLELEKKPDTSRTEELFEVLYRSAHSMKGASRAVEFHDIESLCHSFEDVMTAVRSGEIDFNSNVFEALYATVDLLEVLIKAMEDGTEEKLSDVVTEMLDNLSLIEAGLEAEIPQIRKKNKTKTQIQEAETKQASAENVRIQSIKTKESALQAPIEKRKQPTLKSNNQCNETIRVSTDKLDSLLAQAEELLSVKLNIIQRSKDLKSTCKKVNAWNKKASNLSPTLQKLGKIDCPITNPENDFKKIVEFCCWSGNQMGSLEKEITDLVNRSSAEEHSVSLKIDNLLENIKNLMTVPFSTLFDGFPKMVRDISKDLQKKVELIVEGGGIEIDRRILEKIHNPIIHILRNSIDYGIEQPNIRISKGKPESGTIKITIEQIESNKIELNITDDGAGINIDALKELYLKNESVSNKDLENISDQEILNYMFKSGVSTSKMVTDLSGRGLGMAIVQDAIEELGGSIKAGTEKDIFTTFTIVLPLNIVTFRGVLVQVAGSTFIIPTQKVNRILRIKKEAIVTTGNRPNIKTEGQYLPLAQLSSILNLTANKKDSKFTQVVILEAKGEKIAFAIEQVLGEQEVLTKSFNRQLTRIPNIMGATILGSGEVVPILNVPDLFNSAQKEQHYTTQTPESNPIANKKKHILIVEDSITSRTLLKNILEAKGYIPTTAIDGVDGYTKLKQGNYSAIVTDVEMPRMNGFELTAKIREDKKYSDIPIVLVTSLSKREHKEKGIEAGANAYIVKSSFNQSNLIETLERLIV